MKRYDCSKVLDYIHELRRLCDHESCRDCPFDYMEDCNNMDIDQSMIDTLQKWSDEHPEKTRAEAFLEMFPKLKKDDAAMLRLPCFKILSGDNPCCARMKGDKCWECWSQPYNGEFEKEEK